MVSATRRSVSRGRGRRRSSEPSIARRGKPLEGTGPRVLAVVVTHNGGEWLGACLSSLANQVYSALDVVVVDCSSSTDVAQQFAHLVPEAEFVKVQRNVGFGAAANLALEVSARAPDADLFLFLHDDVELEPEAVSLLIATQIETEAGIVGGKGLEWDHVERLVEVGMSADQFGYPYSGLEPGEIDQGQHDSQREVLFVTNACMLVSRKLIETCGLWDGAYFAFGEDLDLCTRGRLAGFAVLVQPGARYRHAKALSNRARAVKPAPSVRFLTRRNRLRTIAKNFSFFRMLAAIPLYFLLSLAEILVLAFFRKFDEIAAYPKALASFLISVPDIVRRRRAVQKRRKIPDRSLRRLMVSDSDRARVFFENRLRVWERGTVEFGAKTLSRLAPSAIKAGVKSWVRRPSTLALAAIVLLLTFSMRGVLLGGAIAAGSLLPFPGETNSFLTEYFAGWRDVGLGTRSAPPVAFPLFWFFGVAGFGKAVVAQKLMVAALVAAGVFGMNRLVSQRTESTLPRFIAMAIYSVNGVVAAILTEGDLHALALYAGLPYMLALAFRILGPPGAEEGSLSPDVLGKHVARLGLITAAVVALGPSALLAVVVMWAFLGACWILHDRTDSFRPRKAGYLLTSVPLAALVLVPWSLEALRPRGAILAPIFSGRRGTFYPLWSEGSFEKMFFLNLHARTAALVSIGLMAGVLVLADSRRRSQARLLVIAWAGFALVGGLAVKGLIPPPVATPQIWLVFPLALAAILGGDLVAGVRTELPRHAVGWRHNLAIPAVGVLILAGFVLGSIPSLAALERPQETFAAGMGEDSASLSSFLVSTAERVGNFRVLWLGPRWLDPIREGARRMEGTEYFLTGPSGVDMLGTQEATPSDGERKLDQTVEAMAGKGLHLAGHLLAPAGIRFIIVDPGDSDAMAALRSQRDIALEQQQPNIAVFRNLQWLPKAVLAPVNLVEAVTANESDDRALMMVRWSGGRPIPQRSETTFRGDLPRTRHSQILLGENFSRWWRASVDGERLEHAQAFGWANRFELPGNARGEIYIRFAGRWLRIAWLLVQGLVILVVAGAAWGGRSEMPRRLR